MSKHIDNFSTIIKAKINSYINKSIVQEEGKVISVGDGVIIASGLTNVMLNEKVEFSNGTFGMVLNLETDYIGIIALGRYDNIQEGSIVKRTKEVFSIGVGDNLLGRVINPIGIPIDGKGSIKYVKYENIDVIASGVMARESVNEPLETGLLVIDSMFPIGKGQRELIVGDRQTGKTTIAIDTIINQKNKNVYCVYVAIGQKNSSIVQTALTLSSFGAMEYTTIVSANASDIPAIKYIAPFAGMAIAEYWMKQGKDVLIIFDDLTKHAISYRTISLLLRRPPGREAFPGDIFYLHSRLLERAGKLNKKNGGGSITALPIVETQAGDISSYIPTNVISITDGQLFMVSSMFNEGQRPAINIGLSVSRVGSAAQIPAIKQQVGSLKLDLAQYAELSSFSQFGNELDDITKSIISHGKRIMAILKQTNYHPIDQITQSCLLLFINEHFDKWIPLNEIDNFKNNLINYIKTQPFYTQLSKTKSFDDKLKKAATKSIGKFVKNFVNLIENYQLVEYGTSEEFKKLGS